ncbi:M23 family metallopeptidase [Sphingomonas qomolangmaensis]|uniref:M23 family metallopeptidase n=1 Tax=Sphingomonas qomolangmaensis TaxID=2918765 RepID=A0ABY5L798_9SPHN|nr:M23 family metallopeptidase [Sphingomonas qomolangmaensis]UUL81554.1 M23 family metallopeptidase [Sphingomonas qomolangmaensis]
MNRRMAVAALLCVLAPISVAAQTAPFALDGDLIQGGRVLGTAPAGTTQLTLNGEPVEVARDGRFVVAFDRDQPANAILAATRIDGETLRQTLAIRPRAWRIERLNTLARQSRPSAEFLKLRTPELARIAAARAKVTAAQGWRQPFVWPVTGRISGLFGSQRIYRGEPGAYHSGVDVARPGGTTIVAPADGVVILAAASPFTLEGNLLMLDHGMGLNSAFLHLSRIDVREGASVRRGQPIGAIGATGRATGPHLHWSMKWHDARIDPLLVAGPMPG